MTSTLASTRQRESALQGLAELRTQITDIQSRLSEGDLALGELLLTDTHHRAAEFAYVAKLMEVVPGIGKIRARRILEANHIAPTCRVGQISSVQKQMIVEACAQ